MQKHAIIFVISILSMAIGHAYAAVGDLTLSNPSMVDMNGHQIKGLQVGKPVGISSIITNNVSGEKRFTYVVRVLDQQNQIVSQEGMSANIFPNQSFTVAESWTPNTPGSYVVQTFVANGYMLSSPLTNIIQTNITVK